MGKQGNWTHQHRVVRERMISRGFKQRGNITITTQRTVCVTLMRYRGKGQMLVSQREVDKDSRQ